MRRRTFSALLSLHAGLVAVPGTASAQAYPARPIRLIIPFGPGSGTDAVARVIGERLSEQLGVPVIPENKDGAGGVIGTQSALVAAPDGYTLLMVSNTLTIAPQLYASAPYDPVNDLTPVAKAVSMPLVLVANPAAPYKTFRELIDYARANPGKLSFATSGKGSQSQLEVEYLKQVYGVEMTDVPYKSVSQGLTDVISGNVALYLTSLALLGPHVKSGKINALALGSAKRSASFPQVPTFAELAGVPSYQPSAWFGFVAPRGTPPEIVRRLGAEISKACASPRVLERVDTMGAEIALVQGAEFGGEIRSEMNKWAKVVAPLGLRQQ